MVQSCLESTQSVVNMLALGAGVYIAAQGLGTWKRQLRGHTEYDLARRLMRAALEVRDMAGLFRHPMIPPGEMVAAYQEAGVDPSTVDFVRDTRTNALVYQRRWGRVGKAMSDLHVEVLEAEVHWGDAASKAEHSLKACLHPLFAAMTMRFRFSSAGGQRSEADLEREKEFDRLLYGGMSEPDLTAKAIADSVAAFEHLVRPHLRTS